MAYCVRTTRCRQRFSDMCLSMFFFSVLISMVSGLSISYCSSQNTGSDFQAVNDMYQSNGACRTTCQATYAYAVLKGSDCWCSNYAPGDTTSSDSCNFHCPGFPFENCGNPDQGLYGYYQLKIAPSGTLDASTSTPTQTPTPTPTPIAIPDTESTSTPESEPSLITVTELDSSSPTTVTVMGTVTRVPDATTVSISIIVSPAIPTTSQFTSVAAASTPATTPSPTTTPSTPATTTWAPTTFTAVTTILGSLVTVIETATVPAAPAETQTTVVAAPTVSKSFWDDTGKVAGTFVAVSVVAVALIAAGIWFLLRQMRNRQNEAMTVESNADEDQNSAGGAPFMTDRRRSNLQLATAGLGGLTRGNSDEKSATEQTPTSNSRRTSIPLVHDQRLNPAALWRAAHDNGSHVSIASFRDDRDYSRPVLHIRNPDTG